MPLETNLSRSPYFDDYNESSDYYSILFKPSVSVQARELNQLQTILQKQIERFGDHVFKSGTIISGVNFRYLPNYQYAKILDQQVDGEPVNPTGYEGLFVRNSANLAARVVKTTTGYQQKNPDLNTLYLQYINSSDTGNTSVFNTGDVLTVYSKDYPVYNVNINNGGLSFSNSDGLLFISALSLSNITGAFSNGETITQATSGAKAQIVGIDTTTSNTTILRIRPRTVDLSNTSANASLWTFGSGLNITGGSSGAVANVAGLVGSGAAGIITTDSLGVVIDVTIQSGGNNYIVPPYTSIKPSSATASLNTLDLTSYSYKAQVTIANNSFTAPVGNGYAFSTTQGIIYQKGHFLRVDPQVTIISKYSSNPDGLVVGFATNEAIVNVNTDNTLYDNALGSPNYGAPGADRLQLVPTLVVANVDSAAANIEFFALAEFKDGAPYKENRNTIYNELGKEFARRTSETSGDFVIDQFLAITKDKDTPNTAYNVVAVDPGTAYISGDRIQTLNNTYLDIRKSTDKVFKNNQTITANYGSYVRVNELAGNFKFKSGDTVSLYDTAQTFLTNVTAPSVYNITPSGNVIGTANIRSLVYESGEPGSPSAVYRLYLFNVKMSAGKAFRNVASIFYNGTIDGICDTVLDYNPITTGYEAVLKDTDNNSLLFKTGLTAVKVANDVSYTYRTTKEDVAVANNGTMTISLITSGEQFPYTADATLSTNQKQDVIVVPLANAEASANLTGTAAVTTTSPNVVGTSTTFTADLTVGDWVMISTASANQVSRVVGITNSTVMTLNANLSFANTTAKVKKFFPAFYPIPVASRSTRTMNTGPSSTTLKIYLNENFTSPLTAAVTYNVVRSSATEVTKSIHRDSYVKVYTGNNAGGAIGPWAMGVRDVTRLKTVYLGNTAGDLDVTKHFYIDQGHDGNFYGQSYLVQRSTSSLVLANTQWLLIKYDSFTPSTEGFLTVSSYNIDDSKTLAASSNTINTLEIPEVITSDKQYYDLRDTFDFRPYVANTVALATSVASAPINPANTEAFNSNDKYFPAPDSNITFDAEYYESRIDRVIAKKDGTFEVLEGRPAITSPLPPDKPVDSITVAIVTSQQYPSLPLVPSKATVEIAGKSVGNDLGEINNRVGNFTTRNTTTLFEGSTQPKNYTMHDIGVLDRRITQLEYYVSLNLLETSVKDLVIPSATNPASNRFKNGFFVDDFDNYSFAEEVSKEFNCKIDQTLGELQPKTKQFNLNSLFSRADATTNNNIYNTSLMLPFVEETLVEQTLATSTVNADGNKTTFAGSMIIDPASFRLKVRGEVKITPDPAPPGNSDGGGHGDCKIICAKLNQLGFFDDVINTADQAFGRQLRDNYPTTFNGYLAWAQTVVDWIDGIGPRCIPFVSNKIHSDITIKYLHKLAKPWAEEMAYQMGAKPTGSLAGKIIMAVGLPLCWIVGALGFKPVEKSSLLRGYAVWGICTVLLATSLVAQGIEKVCNVVGSWFKREPKYQS